MTSVMLLSQLAMVEAMSSEKHVIATNTILTLGKIVNELMRQATQMDPERRTSSWQRGEKRLCNWHATVPKVSTRLPNNIMHPSRAKISQGLRCVGRVMMSVRHDRFHSKLPFSQIAE